MRRHRIRDHARLAALDLVDLIRLVLNGKIAMHDADAALAGHCNRHSSLGHGVHRTRHEWLGDRDAAGQTRGRVRLRGNDVGVRRKQEHVVVSQTDVSKRVVQFHEIL